MYNHFDKNRFAKALKERGISQTFIANKLGVSRNAVNMWANGHKKPDSEHLKALCSLLEISPEYLTGDSDFPTVLDHIHHALTNLQDIEELAEESLNALLRALRIEKCGSWWQLPETPDYVDEVQISSSIPFIALTDAETPPKDAERVFDLYRKNGLSDDPVHALLEGYDLSELEGYALSEKDLKYLSLELLDYVKMRITSISDFNKPTTVHRFFPPQFS